ncbi:MAG: histidine phosphatase family protein [Proteobacteria bacterium]|nr:histidine phosphatase family protein [Pseudomonadota bacterium]
MTVQILLVSHALTQWNVDGRIQGHTDVPLNPQGRKMALLLSEQLAKETIHAIYTSDLKRAYQTAVPTALQKSLKIIQDIDLREGRSINQERSAVYPTLPFPTEIETQRDVSLRMTAALCRIALCHEEQTVLVVSHGGAVEIFIKQVLETSGEPESRYQGIRMAVNRICCGSGSWHCLGLNEV